MTHSLRKPPLEPGYEGRRELSVERVRDPWPHPDNPLGTVEAVVNVKESPIEWLYRRKKISEQAKLAADKFRAIYERAEVGGARGIDYAQPRVDGGQIARSVISAATADAHRDLAGIRRAVGPGYYRYLSMIVGEGMPIQAVAKRVDGVGLRLTREGVAWSLKEALAELILFFGTTTGAANQPIRAAIMGRQQ